jgi:sugar O-acyltransferase (sialic acid O-acetyltransferase NeuD family)
MKTINPDIKFGTVIDPSVEMSDLVTIGEGTIICAHTIITVNIEIGSHVIINLDCTVGHDAVLQDFVTLYPSVNVSGITNTGHAVELGTGMQIIQGKTVGDYSIVGAGAVVVKDIPAKCTAVGSPAKPIKFFE